MAFFISSKLGFAPFFVYCPEYHSGILVFPPPVLLSRFPSREIPASTPYTLHQKNRPTKRFFLLNQKKYCTFAPVISPRLGIMSFGWDGCIHNKALKALCVWLIGALRLYGSGALFSKWPLFLYAYYYPWVTSLWMYRVFLGPQGMGRSYSFIYNLDKFT